MSHAETAWQGGGKPTPHWAQTLLADIAANMGKIRPAACHSCAILDTARAKRTRALASVSGR